MSTDGAPDFLTAAAEECLADGWTPAEVRAWGNTGLHNGPAIAGRMEEIEAGS